LYSSYLVVNESFVYMRLRNCGVLMSIVYWLYFVYFVLVLIRVCNSS